MCSFMLNLWFWYAFNLSMAQGTLVTLGNTIHTQDAQQRVAEY